MGNYWSFKLLKIRKFSEVAAIMEKLGLERQDGRRDPRKWRKKACLHCVS